MSRLMAAHQPNFLPYLGFFDKMRVVDEMGTEPGVFVIRDDCQYVKRDFHHRNKIRTNTGDGWMWLYVPVAHSMTSLSQIKIRHDGRINGGELWTKFHLRMIGDNYRRTPFFDGFYPGLEAIYKDPGDSLCDFNRRLIAYLADCFGIGSRIISFHDLCLQTDGADASEALARIARAVGASIYLSGDGGRNYIDRPSFGSDVHVRFHDYVHPVYGQRYPGFVPHMSALDALFNIGRLPRSGEVVGAM